MRKFYQFQTHDYMDMYPRLLVYAFPSVDEAKAFATNMNQNYSGGTTAFIKEMSSTEAYEYVCKQINELILDYNKYKDSPTYISHVSKDKFIQAIQKLLGLLNECYPIK